jgi:hypothetical protein
MDGVCKTRRGSIGGATNFASSDIRARCITIRLKFTSHASHLKFCTSRCIHRAGTEELALLTGSNIFTVA